MRWILLVTYMTILTWVLIFLHEAVAEIVSICLGCFVVVILFVGAVFYR